MRLYIANPTQQKQVICYRLDYDKNGNLKDTNRRFSPATQQEILPGRQIQLGGDMHENQIKDIVRQLEPYGLIHVSHVPSVGRVKVPYVFDFQPVSADVMRRVQFHNDAALTDDGRIRRASAAVASNDMVQQAVQTQFVQYGIDDKPAESTVVAFEQQEQTEREEKVIQEGYEIVPEGKRGARSGKFASKSRRR